MPDHKPIHISAFGALNADSYAMFGEHLSRVLPHAVLKTAGPYPNAAGVSQPGRPLRAEALQDEKKKEELFLAVAGDARATGAEGADLRCMPCMSMIGFHAGVEKALGLPIFPLAPALVAHYAAVDKVGVLHMRPAKQRIVEIFGDKAVVPDDAEAARLLAAEEEGKRIKNAAPVEAVMKDLAERWRARGLKHILFARADAPLAETGPAGKIDGLVIDSTFGILARAIAKALCVMALVLPLQARAAEVPSTADPARAMTQIAPLPMPQEHAAPEHEHAAPQTPVPDGAAEITFVLSSVTIDGMTVYGDADMRSFYAAFAGRKTSFADLYKIADAMTAKYRNDGYILSQVVVPEQEIEGGRVTLMAVEGFVDKVTVRGEGDTRFIAAMVAPIAKSRPLNNAVLERAVMLVNDLPGISAEAVMGPSPATPGAADITLVLKRKPYDVSFAADNRGSRYIGPVQFTGGATLNDVLGYHESLTAQVATAPGGWPRREMTYGGLTWTQPVGHNGTKVTASYALTSTHPGYTIAMFDIHGVSRLYSIGASHPFIRARAKTVMGTVKFDWMNSERGDNLGIRTEDRLRVLRAGGSWQFTDGWGGSDYVGAEFSKGLSIFNATDRGSLAATRIAGDPAFFKGTLSISRVQNVGGPWDVYTGIEAQKSAQLLLSSEEFGIGGANTGSAYDSSELTGEDGVALRTELRRGMAAPLVQALQPYAFYDIGKVWNRDDAVPKHRRASLADAGIGVRAQVNDRVFASFEAAQPLTRPVAASGRESARFFFSLNAKF